MKRRKFATVTVVLAALLVAAAAAASVSAATSSHKAASAKGPGYQAKNNHKNAQPKLLGTAQFVPTVGQQPKFINSPTPSNAKSILQHDRVIPGKLGPSGKASSKAASSTAGAVPIGPPHAHSLPITSAKYDASAPSLNAYNQVSTGGYTDTPPDQALAEGNGFVFAAVNNVFQITDTNFGHVTNVEPMEQFFGSAMLTTGFDSVSDPKANYDNVTRKWYVTEVAYGNVPGSAVFIAVSVTSDPLGIWNIYILDTSFDGTTCGINGCLADQPLLGMNRNALFISTNSFDFVLGGAFNGTQMYIIDSTALAAGLPFPNVVYYDIGGFVSTPEGFDGCGTTVYPGSAYCWYSIQPATTPNQAFSTDRGGTEIAMSALDWFGSVDNRIALWAFTNTQSISSFIPDIEFNWALATTESYGFPFTDTPFFSPFAEQPSSGHTPLCDFFVGPFCEPGPIANNDDRMNEVKSIKPFGSASHNWGGLNTDALVADPLGHLHRRSAIAYFDLSPCGWFGPGSAFIGCAAVNGQGYIANWNNDVVFPAIGVPAICNSSCGDRGAIVYTLTGNTNFPSVAVSMVSDAQPVKSIPVVLAGQDVLDDFAWYFFGTPRWGDYSAAVADGHNIFLGTEYIQHPSCDDSVFVFDGTCNGTRSEFSNWGTGLVRTHV